jgi:hypothetical protein
MRDLTVENDINKLRDELKGRRIQDPDTETTRGIQPEDLSLYKNCLMVCNRIWVPEPLQEQFIANVHLGHRGHAIMK